MGRARVFGLGGVVVAGILLSLLGTATAGRGETPMSPEMEKQSQKTDPELEAKKREADLAEAEARLQKALKEAAESEKGRLAASLPTPASKPMEGKVEVDDKAGFFAELLAYDTARDNAAQIADSVSAHLGSAKTIYLVRQPDYLKGALQLQEIEARLQAFGKIFDTLRDRYPVTVGVLTVKESAILGAVATVPAVLGALADVAALFRVDRSIKGRQPTVSDESLAAEVVGQLKTKGNIIILRPSLNSVPNPSILKSLKSAREKSDAVSSQLAEVRMVLAVNSNVIESIQAKISRRQTEFDARASERAAGSKDIKEEIKRLRDLFEKVPADDKREERVRLGAAVTSQENLLAELSKSDTDERKALHDDLEGLRNSLDGPRDQKVRSEVAVSQMEAILKAFTEFSVGLTSVPSGGTTSPLANLAETSVLHDAPDGALVLAVAVSAQGGEFETRKSIWTSGSIYHRAGSACTYSLFDKEGRSITSGLVVATRQSKEGRPINVPASQEGAQKPNRPVGGMEPIN